MEPTTPSPIVNAKEHFNKIFWFVVGLCIYGALLTIFLVVYLPADASKRIAESSMMFWLGTAVSGGIGYLIGSSASKPTPTPPVIPQSKEG